MLKNFLTVKYANLIEMDETFFPVLQNLLIKSDSPALNDLKPVIELFALLQQFVSLVNPICGPVGSNIVNCP
jgi:hypothetical protein